jgi:hypothetical protein
MLCNVFWSDFILQVPVFESARNAQSFILTTDEEEETKKQETMMQDTRLSRIRNFIQHSLYFSYHHN